MNDAKAAAKGEVHAKMSRAAKNRWKAMSPEQRSAQMAKMRAARQASGAGDN